MHIKTLYLRNFRNYEEEEFHFSPKINVIFGDNAQGKTNLLEAISLLSTGRSFRTHHLQDLISEKASFFHLEAEASRDGISHLLKLTFDGKTKTLHIDSNIHTSFQPLLGLFPLILLAPEDEELVSGSPNLRRRFLNLHLVQSDPLYVHHFTRNFRAMKQRNQLLRTRCEETLEHWDLAMAESAAYIALKREELIEELKAPLAAFSEKLTLSKESHELKLHLSYPKNVEGYLVQLKKNRQKERDLGATLTGPHRDDFSLWVEGRHARSFASEGQKKTAAAALRLAEWERLAKRIEETPLMAIDDLGLPLDPKRLEILSASLKRLGQVFITAPEPLAVFGADRLIEIRGGKRI